MASTDSRFWHPFADMNAVRSSELTLVSGDGVHVTDEDGNRYLDGTASLWNVNVGHGRTELADAAAAQMRELATYGAFGAFNNKPARELTDRLAGLAPVDDPRIFLTSGGGDSIDTAAKLARRYFAAVGQPERVHLISRSQGYHGTHGLGTSIGGIAANRVDVGPLDPNSSQVPHDSLEALEAEIERVGADRVAAVFVEPVIGAGGVHQPQPGYIEGLDALCKRTGVFHVVDAVIAGFGRLGEWFGPERWGIRPDMITFAKGVTSGYLPLGGVVVSGQIAAPFWDEPNAPWFRHGPTYAGHPTCCAVALANLDIIEREGLLARGLELQDDIERALRPFESHALAGEVRAGTGALGAVGLSAEALSRDPKAPLKVFAAARDRGVLIRPLGDGVAISPPLIATREDIETAASAISDALDAVASELGVTAAA
jgi:adenosylmethionine-8-amino-7-oxononanoate aminotransferase